MLGGPEGIIGTESTHACLGLSLTCSHQDFWYCDNNVFEKELWVWNSVLQNQPVHIMPGAHCAHTLES